MSHLTPSGIEGLDELLGGGLPRGGLVVLAGNPGTGKTIFSAQFLYRGAVDHGERGLYVSFAEDKYQFYRNTKALGLDFERLEEEGLFSFLDMLTVREEGVSTALELIISKVAELGAERLAIDSFSAMAQAFREPHDARVVLHTVLSKIARSMNCTTLLVIEVPHGSSRIGLGIEEFVADGIIVLKRALLDGRPLRELEVLKMRGTPTPEAQAVFTLKGGFKVFSPFKAKGVERPRRFRPIPDPEGYFSTGSRDLDEVLGGGYPRGSTVLFEIGKHVSLEQYGLVITPTLWNFVAHGRGVLDIPSAGVDYTLVKRRFEEGGFTDEEINELLRVCTRYYVEAEERPYIVRLEGEDPLKGFERCLGFAQELIEKTSKPLLKLCGVDMLIDAYGVAGALSYLKACATEARRARGLHLVVLKPGYPRLASILDSIADVHLKVVRRHGSVLLYGVKPRTNIYVLEMDVSEGYPMPKLTPVI